MTGELNTTPMPPSPFLNSPAPLSSSLSAEESEPSARGAGEASFDLTVERAGIIADILALPPIVPQVDA